ncbi:endonuclease/exonuclease/phosphatase family protein [Marinomonas transparens]|uniref:Endonuclease/exonuclease/phosphatase family protein n=1 Tax=Marinomonas transparens TaxID=2795388 RepID=A0A934JPT2_9GAMM|nr:endonuclease/exonuclease/phosphatase family protein [Marinomonas transparens]MBJ7539701.1 endonuclease/exonuclease/phosphatase family protein [Marinomonas transparens]
MNGSSRCELHDGAEQRNVCRNHDEIRFWSDYLSAADYLVDDQGRGGGLGESPFVLLGDLNASPYEGDASRTAITGLLRHPKMAAIDFPQSLGGIEHSPKVNQQHSALHTAVWRMQVDYVRPSRALPILQQAVFWPHSNDSQFSLLKNTSDHLLVFLDLTL